jgi:hypothetical protein
MAMDEIDLADKSYQPWQRQLCTARHPPTSIGRRNMKFLPHPCLPCLEKALHFTSPRFGEDR